MVLGVTGKYGAGKDEVTRILVAKGFSEINVDALGHRALEECKPEVVRAFGGEILTPEGQIDRRALGQLVFSCKARLKALEAIVHPHLKELVNERLSQLWGHIVINAALLFKLGLEPLVDAVFIIRAPFYLRLKRAMERDRLSLWQLGQRFICQYKIIPKKSHIKADTYYIENTGSRIALTKRVERVLHQLKTREGLL